MKSIFIFPKTLVFCLCFCSCSNIVVNYGNPTPNSGHIVVKTNYAVYTNLTLNDSLLIDGKHVKSITIKNVPEGVNYLHYSGDSQNFKLPWMRNEK
jgi:hypothetical protein